MSDTASTNGLEHNVQDNHQQSQATIRKKKNGPVGAATPDKAESDTTLIKSVVPDRIQHPAGAKVNQVARETKPAAPDNTNVTATASKQKFSPPAQGPVEKRSRDQKAGAASLTGSAKVEIAAKLRKREKIIRQGREAWRDGSKALMEIRDLRLYRAKGYTDFGKYSSERLHMGKSTVNRHIAIAEVYKELASMGAKILPTSERQMRPLLSLKQPEQELAIWGKSVAEAWAKAVQEAEILKTGITQKSVARAIHQLGLDPKSIQTQPEFSAQRRWAGLEAYLEHEREFWPAEHRRYLSEHIAALVRCWETGMKHLVFNPDHPASVVTEDWDKPSGFDAPKLGAAVSKGDDVVVKSNPDAGQPVNGGDQSQQVEKAVPINNNKTTK